METLSAEEAKKFYMFAKILIIQHYKNPYDIGWKENILELINN